MLQVVDDERLGRAQLVLERERIRAVKRAKEMAHEIFRAKEKRPLAALAKLQGCGVQEMGLAVAEPGMNEDKGNLALAAFGKSANGAVPEFVGGAGNEAVEGLCRMKNAIPEALTGIIVEIGDGRGGRWSLGGLMNDIAANRRPWRDQHDRHRLQIDAECPEGSFDPRRVMVCHPIA